MYNLVSNGIALLVLTIALIVEINGLFIKNIHDCKDYKLAKTDFRQYQYKKALQVMKDLKTKEEYSSDIEKTYGKQKKHYPAAMTFQNQPDGKIRP